MNALQKRMLSVLAAATALAVGIAAVFWAQSHGEKRSQKEHQERRLLKTESVDSVVSLTLSSHDHGSIKLKRHPSPPSSGDESHSTWLVADPVQTPANDTVVEGIIRHVLGLRYTHAIEEKNQQEDLAEFGLDKPRFSISLRNQEGHLDSLLIGKKNSFNGDVYVVNRRMELGSGSTPPVYMAPGSLEYQVDKSLFDVRAKHLAKFDKEAVQRLTVTLDKPERDELPMFVVVRDGDGFRMEEPHALKADPSQINGMLAAINNLAAQEFVSESMTDKERSRYGLSKPAAILKLEFAQPDRVLEYRLGEVENKGYVTLMRHGRPDGRVIELPGENPFRKFALSLWHLRDKHVLSFDRDAVASITLRSEDAEVSLQKSSEAESTKPKWLLQGSPGGEARASVVEGLLYTLKSLEAVQIPKDSATPADLKKAKLDPPELTVELKSADGEVLEVLHVGAPNGDARYARSALATQLALVAADRLEGLSTAAADYLESDDGEASN